MLDIHLFRNNPELIRKSQRKLFEDEEIVGEIIRYDEVLRTRQFELDELRRNNNLTNKQIAKLKIAGKDVDAALLIQDTEDVKRSIVERDAEVQETRDVLVSKLERVGNLVHDSVPVSNDEADNVVVRTWGKKRTDSKLKNHVELVDDLGIANLIEGANVAGSKGYFLEGDGVELNQALITFGLNFLKQKGYKPIQTPFIMTQNAMKKCAQLAQYDDELYKVPSEREEKYMIATAEQPLCAYHMDKRFDSASLPIRYAGFSTCFRKEAGAHGKDTRGLFRLHQFEKIEQFCITSPHDNKSWEMHEEMIKNAEEFYQLLKLPYQVVSIVSGALNDAAAKKYDLEAWFPASNTYRELVSCSNCTDYQSRKLGLRFVGKKGNEATKEYCHILNSTLTATERTICCILENYQTKDGVEIPEVLRPLMGGRRFMFNKDYKPEEEDSKPKSMGLFGTWLLEAFKGFNLLFDKIKGLLK